MVPTYSVWIPRVPTYSGFRLFLSVFNYGAFTLFRSAFHLSSSNLFLFMTYPLPLSYFYVRFGLFRFRSPLLSESIVFFLFLRVFRCFSSPGSPDITMCSLCRITTLLVMSSLIRTSAVLRLFATPRSFSQLVTSFFGAMYQGILHTLFVAYSSFSILLFFVFRLRLLFLKKILSTVFRINLDQIFYFIFDLISLILFFLVLPFCTCLIFSFHIYLFRFALPFDFSPLHKSMLSYAVVNLLFLLTTVKYFALKSRGGLKWTRTIDLTLIRRVL